MWTVTLTHTNGTVTHAQAVTRADARTWARQYCASGDRITITPPTPARPGVSLVKAYVTPGSTWTHGL